MPDLNNTASLIAIIGSIVAIWLSIRRTPVELKGLDATTEKTDAETIKIYEEAAALAASRAIELSKQLAALEASTAQRLADLRKWYDAQIKRLQDQIDDRECEIGELRDQLGAVVQNLEDIREYAVRLMGQVRSLGGDPVPFKADRPPTEPPRDHPSDRLKLPPPPEPRRRKPPKEEAP